MIKITKVPTDAWPNRNFGLNPDAISYLMRLEKMNRLAPHLDYLVIGVTPKLGSKRPWPSLVTQMRFIEGREPDPGDLQRFMTETLGFRDEGLNVYAHPSGFKLGDVHTGNFIQTRDGRMVPIDVTVEGEIPA